MLNKSTLIGFLIASALFSTVFCREGICMTIALPSVQQDIRNQDTPTASASAKLPVALDRSGIDKASVHLQILQQSSAHFVESAQAKKPPVEDKKTPAKAHSNSWSIIPVSIDASLGKVLRYSR